MIRPAKAARFRPGDAVRVPNITKKGHVRTPDYVRGKHGRVASVLGEFPDPESLAYGGAGLPEKPLYRVRFRQSDPWEGQQGAKNDTIYLHIYKQLHEPDTEDD